jgi:hypothetical protein
MPTSERKIVLFGPPDAGKSTYLSSLTFFGGDSMDSGRRLTVLPASGHTAAWVDSALMSHRVGQWGATQIANELKFHLYSLPPLKRPSRFESLTPWMRRTDPARVEGTLQCWDVPGEFYERPDGIRVTDDLFQNLIQADGMILLISRRSIAAQKPHFADLFFQSTFSKIINHYADNPELGLRKGFNERSRKIPFPVALCISQIDEMVREDQEITRGLGAEDFLVDMLGGDRQLLGYFSKRKVFGLSALGNRLRIENEQKILDGAPEPIGVLEPLYWLLEEMGENGS